MVRKERTCPHRLLEDIPEHRARNTQGPARHVRIGNTGETRDFTIGPLTASGPFLSFIRKPAYEIRLNTVSGALL